MSGEVATERLAAVRMIVDEWQSGRFSDRHYGAHQAMHRVAAALGPQGDGEYWAGVVATEAANRQAAYRVTQGVVERVEEDSTGSLTISGSWEAQ